MFHHRFHVNLYRISVKCVNIFFLILEILISSVGIDQLGSDSTMVSLWYIFTSYIDMPIYISLIDGHLQSFCARYLQKYTIEYKTNTMQQTIQKLQLLYSGIQYLQFELLCLIIGLCLLQFMFRARFMKQCCFPNVRFVLFDVLT